MGIGLMRARRLWAGRKENAITRPLFVRRGIRGSVWANEQNGLLSPSTYWPGRVLRCGEAVAALWISGPCDNGTFARPVAIPLAPQRKASDARAWLAGRRELGQRAGSGSFMANERPADFFVLRRLHAENTSSVTRRLAAPRSGAGTAWHGAFRARPATGDFRFFHSSRPGSFGSSGFATNCCSPPPTVWGKIYIAPLLASRRGAPTLAGSEIPSSDFISSPRRSRR